jgi:glycosyltransferase involved in cell wall biosynthesis
MKRVAAVIPAYNEAGRIGRVLEVLRAIPELSEIIVVSDGSTDGTYEIACNVPGVHAIQLTRNRGKGGAMLAGARHAQADVLLFFDADLIGLTPQHVRDLIAPVCTGDVDMATGIFQGGRWATDLAQYFSPGITGQRAIRRDVFLRIPNLDTVGYGIELAITYYVRHNGYATSRVVIRGVTHPMKEEKLGPVRGTFSRANMYWQMSKFRLRYELQRLRQRGKPLPPPGECDEDGASS